MFFGIGIFEFSQKYDITKAANGTYDLPPSSALGIYPDGTRSNSSQIVTINANNGPSNVACISDNTCAGNKCNVVAQAGGLNCTKSG